MRLAEPVLTPLGRLLTNRCEKHREAWGDGEHEGCSLCAVEFETIVREAVRAIRAINWIMPCEIAPDIMSITREVVRDE